MKKPIKSDEDYRIDFEDSVIMEELPFDTLPAELMAEFEESAFGQMIEKDTVDAWSSEIETRKQLRNK